MLLLNAVRVGFCLIAFLIIDAFRRAYDLESLGLAAVAGLILILAFTASDVAEAWLEDYFNSEA